MSALTSADDVDRCARQGFEILIDETHLTGRYLGSCAHAVGAAGDRAGAAASPMRA